MGNKLDVKASPTTQVTCKQSKRRHRITPDAGHALEKLAHAIEYLADELVDKSTSLSADNERIQAIQILMALNRQVYFECPVVPSFGERCRALLGELVFGARLARGVDHAEHHIGVFQGAIRVGQEKTVIAEEITMTFGYVDAPAPAVAEPAPGQAQSPAPAVGSGPLNAAFGA